MRLALILLLNFLMLSGCLPDPQQPSESIKPAPEPDELDTPIKIKLPLYTYDEWDVPITEAQVGDTIVLDATQIDFNTELNYNWVTWTGEEQSTRGWNSGAFGSMDRSLPTTEFSVPFPGYYKISWCPVQTSQPCVSFGELHATGEAPENRAPSVDFFYEETVNFKTLCATSCQTLIPTGASLKLIAEIDDDDTAHTFSWRSTRVRQKDSVESAYGLTAEELVFSPSIEGSYQVKLDTFDGHVTVNGPQSTPAFWNFVAREADNRLPTASFNMVGHPAVTASMSFLFDAENQRYFPSIQYFYETTFSIDDCNPLPGCNQDDLRFDTFQNNNSGAIPEFQVGDRVDFDASNSVDPDGDELSFLWSGFVDKAENGNGAYLKVGDDSPTFSVDTQVAGDYYISLCVQERDTFTLYSGADRFVRPLYDLPFQRCPQIQFRVTE